MPSSGVVFRARAHIRLFLFVSLFGLLPVSSYSVVGCCDVPGDYVQDLPQPFCRFQEGRWKRVVFVRAGLQGRTWIAAVSCRRPPGSRGSSGRSPTGALP